MKNIIKYIEKYGNATFSELKFNEIDNLVLCELTYLDFNDLIKSKISIEELYNLFNNKFSINEIKRFNKIKKESYEVFKKISNTSRYKNIKIYNYVYSSDDFSQFCAMTFKYNKNSIYVAYEGTDELISGWREDFEMSYNFPVKAQELAIKYLNKTVSILDLNIIVGGHSKGGNLALVASMYSNFLIRKRIKKIYNNDGPGLRKEELNSVYYKRIKEKHIHIVPNYSYIGVLLRNDGYKVIKSNKKNIWCHSMATWQITDCKLEEAKLSKLSKNLENSILGWLDTHNYKERKIMIEPIFDMMEEANIKTVDDLRKSKNVIAFIKNMNTIDEETKNLALDFLKFNVNYLVENIKK